MQKMKHTAVSQLKKALRVKTPKNNEQSTHVRRARRSPSLPCRSRPQYLRTSAAIEPWIRMGAFTADGKLAILIQQTTTHHPPLALTGSPRTTVSQHHIALLEQCRRMQRRAAPINA